MEVAEQVQGSPQKEEHKDSQAMTTEETLRAQIDLVRVRQMTLN
jgi:hypothetical protein